MSPFILRAHLKTPLIRQGFVTLDALLMAVLGRGDVRELLHCEDDLYFASAGTADNNGIITRASFVASMRADHMPDWLDVIAPNTLNQNLQVPAGVKGRARYNDLKIGLSRQREAGNIVNAYTASVSPTVEWYAMGNAEKVLDALKDVPFIGKRRSSGYGEVSQWEVEPGELDGLSGYLEEPLRPVPVERWKRGGDWIPVEAAWKAPYWDVRNRTCCYAPSQS